MAQSSINIRMDAELKREFDALCNDMGMTMTTAMTIFAKTMVRENRIPFEITGSTTALDRANPLESLNSCEPLVDVG